MDIRFTDEEYRILLSALSRERKVCEKVDAEGNGEVNLGRLMDSIEKKISRIQYPKQKTESEDKGILILDMPDCCITPEGRVQCPLAWQQQFCSKYSPKGLDITGGDWNKIYESRKRPEFCPIQSLESFKSRIINEHIDETIKQLEELKTESQNAWAGYDDETAFGEMNAYETSINIIKGEKDEDK